MAFKVWGILMIQTFILTIDTNDAFTADEIEEYLGIQLDNHVDQSWNSFKVVKKNGQR